MAKVRHFRCFGLTETYKSPVGNLRAFCFDTGESQAIAALRANYSRPEAAIGHVECRRCVICCCFGSSSLEELRRVNLTLLRTVYFGGQAVLDTWRPVSNRRTLFLFYDKSIHFEGVYIYRQFFLF